MFLISLFVVDNKDFKYILCIFFLLGYNDLMILLEGELFESVSRTLSHVGTVLGGAAQFQVIFNKCKFKCITDCQFARVPKLAMMPSPFLEIIQKLPFF